MRLKIGDDFLDSDDSIIAQTYAVNEIGDIETRQGGFSNDFTLPLTAKNKGILEYPQNINNLDRSPYTKVDACLFDGATCVAVGFIRYQVVTNDREIEVSFFADNVNWFTLIKNLKLTDLNLDEFDHNWSSANIVSSHALNLGYVHPLINYGSFDVPSLVGTQVQTNFTEWLPAMFVNKLVEAIFFDVGWKIQGDIIDSKIFNRMILPWSGNDNILHSQAWVDDKKITDEIGGADQPFTDAGATLTWDSAGTDLYPAAPTFINNEFIVSFSIVANISAGNVDVTLDVTQASYNESIIFQNFGGNKALTGTFPILNMVPNANFTVNIIVTAVTAAATGDVVATSTVTLTPSLIAYGGNDLQMAACQPPMKQTDFLGYLSFIFGGIFQANALSKTVTWNFFRNLKSNLSNSVDWSSKLDLSNPRELDFTQLLDKYFQTSIITYKDDTDDTDLVKYKTDNNEVFGQGSFNINNEHISGIGTIYETVFSPMTNQFSFENTMYIPSINFFKSGPSTKPRDVNKVLPKIALIESKVSISSWNENLVDVRIVGNAGVANVDLIEIPFVWFAKIDYMTEVDDIIDTLVFEQVNLTNINGTPLKTRYLEDYEDILDSMKYLKAFLLLNEVDIANLDFTIPVYLEKYKAYFYISKILNFIGRNQTTEVEITKIA